MKIAFQKNYKALGLGAILTILIVLLLSWCGVFIHVSTPYLIFINILLFIFYWLILSFSIHQFSIYKIAGLLGVLAIGFAADRYLGAFNPFTIPLVILFWLGVAYLILPQFFKKYKVAIFSAYGLVLSYFFFFMMSNYPESHLQPFLNSMFIPIPVFGTLWVYEQWRWLKTLKADKAKAELALLKSQVNPHFFFNTLNNLYGLVVEKSPQAPEVVLKLSDMMRYTIYEGKEELVNLKDEVNYLESYIELHKIRYQKKVDIQFIHALEQELKIAPLLFIILLENAFKHGVEGLTEKAYIHMDLKTKNNEVFFTIENNYEPNNTNQKGGIGLDNLKQRLAHIYPNRHELKIEKTDTIYKAHLNLDLRL